MFEKFTEKARRVVFFARYEVSETGSPLIDTEHLLLGVMHELDLYRLLGVSASIDTVKDLIAQKVPLKAKIPTTLDIPFSEAAKRALTFAAEEGETQTRVTAGHVLLGLLREENCLAQQILAELGVTLDSARTRLAEEGEETTVSQIVGRSAGMAQPSQEFHQAVVAAIEEATQRQSTSARPEHLLLGLLRDQNSIAARILLEAGLDAATIRKKLGWESN